MIIINPIPGQEEENANFVEKNGAGIWLKKGEHIETVLDDILSKPSKLEEMTTKAKKLSKKDATKSIYEILLNELNKKQNIT